MRVPLIIIRPSATVTGNGPPIFLAATERLLSPLQPLKVSYLLNNHCKSLMFLKLPLSALYHLALQIQEFGWGRCRRIRKGTTGRRGCIIKTSRGLSSCAVERPMDRNRDTTRSYKLYHCPSLPGVDMPISK